MLSGSVIQQQSHRLFASCTFLVRIAAIRLATETRVPSTKDRTLAPFATALGLSPDLVSFNTAIDACAAKGNWFEAIRLLEEDMVDAKVGIYI